ncbi:glycosyltransferase [Granulicella tundricola]|uniref:Glycosyl transferase family 2 n=1 Tax=Granulicella tundricola (strain ATCC BAA-1859 / DSM 23138 / MP5ACTX9) TaxID=1198114 RepID=E8X7T3_GRATM|nr:glycosyltransferase [Granulicella tundricola]ADW71517.1 glycosyl transferase family 2 [Granulicella tundricola MP5ACTX9]
MGHSDKSPTSENTLSQPLVTICVTAYRRPTMILQSLLSCTTQDYRPLEINISDDSPNDLVEKMVRSVAVPEGIKLSYRRNIPSLGEPGNVNSLFEHASGQYLLLLHDDDVLLPGAIRALVNAMADTPAAVAAFGGQDVITDSGELDPIESKAISQRFKQEPHLAGIITDPLLCSLEHRFPNDGYLVESAAARAIGYRSVAEVGRAGDCDFAIRLGLHYQERSFILVADTISQYRLTKGSSRTNVGICWRHYEVLAKMENLTLQQTAARDELMEFYTPYALVDNAVFGQRQKALSIFFAKGYRRQSSFVRRAYHLLLIFFPQIYRLRRFVNLEA